MLWAPPGRELATRAGAGGAEQLANRSLKGPCAGFLISGLGQHSAIVDKALGSLGRVPHTQTCPASGGRLARAKSRSRYLFETRTAAHCFGRIDVSDLCDMRLGLAHHNGQLNLARSSPAMARGDGHTKVSL